MIEQNGFQILVWREIFHKISHFAARFGQKGTFGPHPTYISKILLRIKQGMDQIEILLQSDLFYGEFHAEQESEIRFVLS